MIKTKITTEEKDLLKKYLKKSALELIRLKCYALPSRDKGLKVKDKEAQNYIGFLNQKNFNCHLYKLSWQNQEEILKAYRQF